MLLETVEIDCPFCDKVHTIEKRQRTAKSRIKDKVVQYEEIYYYCPLSNRENEFVSGEMMDENIARARGSDINVTL